MQLGQVDRAETLLKRAIDVAPSRLEAYGLLGRIYAAQRRIDEATAQFQQLVQRNPKSIAANTMLAMLLEAGQKWPDAEKQYRQTLGLDPRAAVAANNLAWRLLTDDRNLDEALQFAQAAVRQSPTEPHFNDTLGWVYYRKALPALAVPHLEMSVKNDPNDPGSRYHLGMAYLGIGDREKAETALRRALSLKRDFEGEAEARKALADIE